MSKFANLVAAMKALTQGEEPAVVTLKVAEDEWYTRPDTVSYGVISLDFEAGALDGDNRKMDVSWEGSMDLFSLVKDGAGWVPLITGTLEAYCGPCWSLNTHTYERETGLFHWEWTFELED